MDKGPCLRQETREYFIVGVDEKGKSELRELLKDDELASRCVAVVKDAEEFIKAHGPFDMIFIDHWKTEYLQDFLLL